MYRLIVFSFFILTFTACFTERIDLDNNVDDNKKLVITGWINSLDEPQFITISNTINYLGEFKPDGVSGAVVTLADETNTYDLIEKEKGNYYLPNDWEAQVGQEYALKVNYENLEYTARHKMNACPELENAGYLVAEDEEFIDSLKIYETVVDFQEIPGEGDAYFGLDYLKGSLAGDSLINGSYADDRFFDGVYFEEVIFSEDDRYFALGDTAIVEFYSIGLETSEFLQDIENEIFRGSPFDAPPANIRTNITGGAIGYFITSDARQVEIIIE